MSSCILPTGDRERSARITKPVCKPRRRAITAEAAAWGSLVGPDGKRPALTRLERLENARLDLLQGIGGTIFDHAENLYNEICAA